MNSSKVHIVDKLKGEECTNIFINAQINTALLFGSIITEDFEEYSDIDIAILSENEVMFNTLVCMEEELEKVLGREVDIINLKSKNVELNLRVNIYDTGEIIYNNDNIKSYNIDYGEVERLYRENESFRFFRKRDVIFNE